MNWGIKEMTEKDIDDMTLEELVREATRRVQEDE